MCTTDQAKNGHSGLFSIECRAVSATVPITYTGSRAVNTCSILPKFTVYVPTKLYIMNMETILSWEAY